PIQSIHVNPQADRHLPDMSVPRKKAVTAASKESGVSGVMGQTVCSICCELGGPVPLFLSILTMQGYDSN
ncbi:hypothetical protein, partial [Streptococcus pneumoniae]|uniref:hypothetical protein n=1 Tax=Streptococcus pneumoniae TaxID=1313 RepID=UPI001E2D2870